jgi:dTDP-4-amino-4,6-dideoxygalactose transaminase
MILQCNPSAPFQQNAEQFELVMKKILENGWYILGNEIKHFEQEFADWVGTSHSVGCANGTDAIELALRALDIGRNDYVLTVSHTASATLSAIERTGAIPVLVDIDPDRYTLCPISLLRTIEYLTSCDIKPKALVLVHLYGQMADIDSISDICKLNEILLIEDCAQAHGSSYQGKTAGNFGVISAFSFYPTKNIGAMGDAGAIVTNEKSLADRIKVIQQYGWKERFNCHEAGINSRLDELQAGLLRVRLHMIDSENARRKEIAQHYIGNLSHIDRLKMPRLYPDVIHSYHQFVVQLNNRDELKDFLYNQGIHTAVHYPFPNHLHRAYTRLMRDPIGLSITELTVDKILSLPMHAYLTNDEIIKITNAINEFFH